MEHKDADRSNTGRENTGETGNQQCSAEKYRSSDYADRSHLHSRISLVRIMMGILLMKACFPKAQ